MLRTRTSSQRRDSFAAGMTSALAVSYLGDQVYLLAFPWILLNVTHNTELVGLQYALEYLPLLVLPVIGVMVDRYSHVNIMMFGDIARFIIVTLILLSPGPGLPLWALYATGIALTVFSQSFEVALQASLPKILSGHTILRRVNARISSASAAAKLVGPAIAGWLIVGFGAKHALIADDVSFLATLGVLGVFWRRLKFESPRREKSTVWREAMEGIRYILEHRLLKAVAGIRFVLGLGLQLGLTVLIFYYRYVVHLDSLTIGILIGVGGGATLVGSLWTEKAQNLLGEGKLIVLGIFLAGVGWVITSVNSSLAGLLLGMACISLPEGAVASAWITLLQSVTPHELLGRVSAGVHWIAWLLLPLAAVLSGMLAREFGVHLVLLSAGAILVVTALGGAMTSLRTFSAALKEK